MKHEIKRSKKYENIANRLISSLPEFDGIEDVRVAYLSSNEEKKKDRKTILADCHKVQERYQWIVPYDFFITVYEPNCIGLNKHQMEILIRHELHHIGIDDEGNERQFYIVPHDVEEFDRIIADEGLHWNLRTGQEE